MLNLFNNYSFHFERVEGKLYRRKTKKITPNRVYKM